jgi:serine/threonine protein kinase
VGENVTDRTHEGYASLPSEPLVDSPSIGGFVLSGAAPARSQSLVPGSTVAERYLVRRVLGQGGMGQVLEVEHLALGRPFALKILRLEKWNDELVRRFNREARALARVTTPRVAQVTDFGVDQEVGPYYVMELLEGETLEDRLQREGRVPVERALAICAELCDALSEVHAASIVPRDLKPSNVGLPRSGPVGVKLLDFGLAASMDDAFLSKITQSQQILGSLPYMAPEQFGSAEPSIAMDIYAVGIVLYESLTGRLPFVAPSTAALIHQILATPPPPLPEELGAVAVLRSLLEQLLAKDPAMRFASAAAAAHALRDAAHSLGSSVWSAHPPTRALESMPATMHAQSIAYLPTAAMPESSPVLESGTRLSSHSAHSPPMPSSSPRSLALRLAIVGALGLVFAAAGAATVIFVLGILDPGEPRAREVEPTPIVPAIAEGLDPPDPAGEPLSVDPQARRPAPLSREQPAQVEPLPVNQNPRRDPPRPPIRERQSEEREPRPVVAPERVEGDPRWEGGTIRGW